MRYREARFPADTPLRVLVGDETLGANLVNVSTTGARLGQMQGVPRHARLTLAYLHHRYPAQVVWTEGGKAGIRFLVPLSKSDLTILRREAGRAMGGAGVPPRQGHGFRELR